MKPIDCTKCVHLKNGECNLPHHHNGKVVMRNKSFKARIENCTDFDVKEKRRKNV